jgi:hypothetical protein
VGGFKGEDIDDAHDEFAVVGFEEFNDNQFVALQDLIECLVDDFLLVFYCVVEDYLQPSITDVEFGDGVILDDLEDEVVCADEHYLECVVLGFFFFVHFV